MPYRHTSIIRHLTIDLTSTTPSEVPLCFNVKILEPANWQRQSDAGRGMSSCSPSIVSASRPVGLGNEAWNPNLRSKAMPPCCGLVGDVHSDFMFESKRLWISSSPGTEESSEKEQNPQFQISPNTLSSITRNCCSNKATMFFIKSHSDGRNVPVDTQTYCMQGLFAVCFAASPI